MIDEKRLEEMEAVERGPHTVHHQNEHAADAWARRHAEQLELIRLARLGLAAERGAAYAAGFEAAKAAALECVLNGENIPNSHYTADIEEAIEALAALPKDGE